MEDQIHEGLVVGGGLVPRTGPSSIRDWTVVFAVAGGHTYLQAIAEKLDFEAGDSAVVAAHVPL